VIGVAQAEGVARGVITRQTAVVDVSALPGSPDGAGAADRCAQAQQVRVHARTVSQFPAAQARAADFVQAIDVRADEPTVKRLAESSRNLDDFEVIGTAGDVGLDVVGGALTPATAAVRTEAVIRRRPVQPAVLIATGTPQPTVVRVGQ